MARTIRNQNVVPMPRLAKPLEKSRGGAKNNKLDLLADYEDEIMMLEESPPESLPPKAA